MAAKPLPSIERLREVLKVDAMGVLRWRVSRGPVCAGSPAMTAQTGRRGYHVGRLDGVMLQRARVVFALTHGRWPVGEARHLDGDSTNDHPGNIVDTLTDPRGIDRPKRGQNPSRYLGVFAHECGRWVARRNIAGRLHYLGFFDSQIEAARAYDAAAPDAPGVGQYGRLRNFPEAQA